MSGAEMQACFFCQEWIPARARHCPYCGESLTFPSRAEILDEQTDLDPILEGQVDGLVLAYLRGVDLCGAFLSGADLFAADLAAADLRGADLGEAHLGSADLSGADLSRANLLGADLSWADLKGATLRGADLKRADLRGARLQGADLTDAVYDAYTLWPKGYDPAAAGAICIQHRRS
jgi:uncharacterized protein YjbI with pentapeptide repeats